MATIQDLTEFTIQDLAKEFEITTDRMNYLIAERPDHFPVIARRGSEHGLKTRIFSAGPSRVLASRFKSARRPDDKSAVETLDRVFNPVKPATENKPGTITTMSSLEAKLDFIINELAELKQIWR